MGHLRARIILLVLTSVMLTGCLARSNPLVDTPNSAQVVAGFWRGLWHGVIAPVAFIVSLFSDDVRVYEVHNTGGWYDFGFVLGIVSVHGGRHAVRRRPRDISKRE
jgi:hypothetical protein